MLNLLFRKWWVVLLQGVALLIVSLFIFANPATVLTSISLWIGILVFLSGVIALLTAIANDKSEHKGLLIFWSLLTLVLGFLLLTHILVTIKSISIMFGLWMLVGGIRFLAAGWVIRSTHSSGWMVILIGILCIIAAIMMITTLGTAAIGISVILGTQFLISAIALIILAFIKKKIGHAIDDKIDSLKKS